MKPRWETASRNDSTFFQCIDAKMGDGSHDRRRYCCSLGTCLAPLGQLHGKGTDRHINTWTLQLLDQLGPEGPSWWKWYNGNGNGLNRFQMSEIYLIFESNGHCHCHCGIKIVETKIFESKGCWIKDCLLHGSPRIVKGEFCGHCLVVVSVGY